ncbi:hypothetical protein GOBAR_DD36807 [Gossypium barbadense]|nr:hypothetical protein GOBAR_DD36807 [Gossypium barbadense]
MVGERKEQRTRAHHNRLARELRGAKSHWDLVEPRPSLKSQLTPPSEPLPSKGLGTGVTGSFECGQGLGKAKVPCGHRLGMPKASLNVDGGHLRESILALLQYKEFLAKATLEVSRIHAATLRGEERALTALKSKSKVGACVGYSPIWSRERRAREGIDDRRGRCSQTQWGQVAGIGRAAHVAVGRWPLEIGKSVGATFLWAGAFDAEPENLYPRPTYAGPATATHHRLVSHRGRLRRPTGRAKTNPDLGLRRGAHVRRGGQGMLPTRASNRLNSCDVRRASAQNIERPGGMPGPKGPAHRDATKGGAIAGRALISQAAQGADAARGSPQHRAATTVGRWWRGSPHHGKHQGCRWATREAPRTSRRTKVVDAGSRLPHHPAPRCRWCSRLLHIRATKVPMVVEAPAHPTTKVPMPLEAPTHLSHQGADAALGSRTSQHQGTDAPRGSRTSKHQGANAARGSRTSEPPRFRWWSRLPHIQAPRAPSTEGSCSERGGIGTTRCIIFYMPGGSPECRQMDRWSTVGMDRWSTAENLTGGDIHVSKTGTLFLARRSRTNRGPTLDLVLEASAYLSTKFADGGRGFRTSEHQGADGARGSRIFEPPRCWRLLLQKGSDRDDSFIVGEGLGSYFSYILGCLTGTDRRSITGNLTGGGRHLRPGMRWADTFFSPTLLHQQGLKLSMVLEAPAHLRHQGADGARGFGTSDRLGADGARGSCTFEPPGCWCCSGHQGAGCGELPNMSEMRTQGHSVTYNTRRIFKSSAKDSTRRSVGITLQGGTRDLSAAVAAPTTRAFGGQRPLLRVGNRAKGACFASSPDSDLEAFSHNLAHSSFASLAFQPSAMTNYANQRFHCAAQAKLPT